MTDDTAHRGYPRPHQDHNAADDAMRLRDALDMIDADVASAISAAPPSASETVAGVVRLASQDEVADGVTAVAVPTVKRVKDMITTLVGVVQDAVGALSQTLATTTAKADAVAAGLSTFQADANAAINARVLLAGNQTLQGGFTAKSGDLASVSGGTFKPIPAAGNFQHLTNNGAHTIVPPDAQGSFVVEYTNGGTAGALTTSGFTKVTGATYATTAGNRYLMFITRSQNASHLHIQAMQ